MSDIKTNVDELDVVKLAAYLADNIEGFSGPIKATKFEGGSQTRLSSCLLLRGTLF